MKDQGKPSGKSGKKRTRPDSKRTEARTEPSRGAVRVSTPRGNAIPKAEADNLKAALFASALDAIVIISGDGKIVELNPAAEKLFGFSRNEVPGKDLVESIIPAELRRKQKDILRRILETEEARRIEFPAVRADGKEIVVEFSVSHVRYAGPALFTGVFRDITDAKLAETVLKTRTRQQAIVAELGQMALTRTDMKILMRKALALIADGLDCEYCKILEYLPEKSELRMLAGIGWDEYAGQQVSAAVDTYAGYALRANSPVVVEDLSKETRFNSHEMVHDRGVVCGIMAAIQGKDRPFGVVGVHSRRAHRFSKEDSDCLQALSNILSVAIERARTEENLRESEDRFRNTFEQAAVGIGHVGADGRWLKVNQKLCQILGYSAEELTQKTFTEVTHRDYVASCHDTVRRLTRGKADLIKADMRYLRKDGSFVWAALTASGVQDNTGGGKYFIAVIEDISERKQLEAELRQSQKMEAIGKLAGGIAHDFNNLLTVINGRSQLLISRLKPGDSVRREFELIYETGERAAALTRQLLAFSRRQVLDPRIVDLTEIVANMQTMLARLIHENIALATALDPDLGKVKADPGQIEQAVMNLAVNARDAMPNGGKLTIETANVTFDEAYLRLHPYSKPGEYAMLAVSDSGCGMNPEVKARVFEPFFTTKEVGKGTGLGLSTVYGIVKQSSGYIEVYSELGKGTVFKIYLPRLSEGASARRSNFNLSSVRGGSETIVVVEDEEGVRELLRDVLMGHGYNVLAAENGDDALRMMAGHPTQIHLLITDVIMPSMSGPELAGRATVLKPALLVLYMSGYTDHAIVCNGNLEPGLNFLQKPFSADSVARKVREVLDAGLQAK